MSGHSSVWGKSRDPKLDNELPPDQVDASEAWKSFGRGTDAGKLLYSVHVILLSFCSRITMTQHIHPRIISQSIFLIQQLYGGKNQTQFTPNVTIKTKPHVDPFEEDRAKKLARAQEIKARKQSVELPDPTPQRRIDPEMLLNYRLRGAHRRQQDTIQDDARQELEQLRLNRRPYMPGTTREETIDTAQKMMEYRGKLPVEPPQPAYVPMRAREPQDEFRARIGEIVDEIEEREQFLEEMRELGQGKQYEARIRGEIGEFLRELRQLEKLLGEDKLSNRYNMIASKAAAAATTGAGALIAPPSGNSAPSPMNAAARMKQARNKV
jgi:hypothetical protein